MKCFWCFWKKKLKIGSFSLQASSSNTPSPMNVSNSKQHFNQLLKNFRYWHTFDHLHIRSISTFTPFHPITNTHKNDHYMRNIFILVLLKKPKFLQTCFCLSFTCLKQVPHSTFSSFFCLSRLSVTLICHVKEFRQTKKPFKLDVLVRASDTIVTFHPRDDCTHPHPQGQRFSNRHEFVRFARLFPLKEKLVYCAWIRRYRERLFNLKTRNYDNFFIFEARTSFFLNLNDILHLSLEIRKLCVYFSWCTFRSIF